MLFDRCCWSFLAVRKVPITIDPAADPSDECLAGVSFLPSSGLIFLVELVDFHYCLPESAEEDAINGFSVWNGVTKTPSEGVPFLSLGAVWVEIRGWRGFPSFAAHFTSGIGSDMAALRGSELVFLGGKWLVLSMVLL